MDEASQGFVEILNKYSIKTGVFSGSNHAKYIYALWTECEGLRFDIRTLHGEMGRLKLRVATLELSLNPIVVDSSE